MKIFISTGEVSGDLQGAMLIESLWETARKQNVKLEIAALGGDRMKAAGAEIIAHTAAIGSMGFIEAIPFVLPTLKIQGLAKKYLQQNPPDILVLIDYPAANLALASQVKRQFPQIPVVYYIAPQDWAVPMLNNTPKIARVIDKLLAIFPGEAQYFAEKQINVTWVGHPLLDRMAKAPDRASARQNLGIPSGETIITLLPASRQQEIKYLLPVMIEAAQQILEQLPQVKYLIPISLPHYRAAISAMVEEHNIPAQIIPANPLEAIAAADLAIAKSGTVNLEIALSNVPQVVIYRISPITAWIGRKLGFSVPLMSPPNLIVNRQLVPEFQQEEVTAENIATQAIAILKNSSRRAEIEAGYREMREQLGEPGVCDRAARAIFQLVQN